MDKLDRGTELLLYISASIVFGFFAFMMWITPSDYGFQLGDNLGRYILTLITIFFILLTLVKLEKGKGEEIEKRRTNQLKLQKQ